MKHKVTDKDLCNWWLKKYHNTNVDEVIKKHPKLSKTGRWFTKYQVTQKQYDQWREWAINQIRKDYGYSKAYVLRGFCWVDLQIGPSVIQDK